MVNPAWIAMAKESIRLGTPSSACILRAEQASVGLAEEDLHGNVFGARIVAGVRIRVEVDLLEIRVAQSCQGFLAGAGRGDHAFENLTD